MKSRFNIFLLSLFVSLPGALFPQSLSLEDAVNLALKRNDKVKQYEEKLTQKKYQDMESWGNFLPSVNIEASYNHLNDPLVIDLNPIREVIIQLQAQNMTGFAAVQNPAMTPEQKAYLTNLNMQGLNKAIPAFTETLKEQDYKSAAFVGVQPLFMGGKILAGKKFASAEKKSAEVELVKSQNEIIQETVTNYLAVALLHDVVKTRQDVVNGVSKHLRNAERLNQEGMIASYHVLRAKVALDEAERNLLDDQSKLELAVIALKTTIGYAETDSLSVPDSLSFSNFNDSLSYCIEKALTSQPALKIVEYKKNAASQKYAVERSNFLPQVAAFGKYEMYPEYQSMMEPRWVVGLQMKFNLFNGFKDYARLQSASHLEKEVSYIEADAKKKVELWVNKSYRDMDNARTKYQKLLTSVELAKENLRLNDARFQTGYGTSLEVIDAQLSLEKTEIEKLSSLFDYYKSLTDLLTASGTPEDILKIWNNKE
jgi:outer membrane protein TolC